MNPSAPFILIGMHRSGTSLVAEILRDAGIFMGADCSKTHTESRFFLNANHQIYSVAHAEWDRPLPVNDLMAEEQVAAGVTANMRRLLDSPQLAKYLGFSRYWQVRSLANLDRDWGWKDPRSTFTLPVWLRIYPRARVLNIYRNGVDVASSLRARERERSRELHNPLFSCRCLDLDRAFAVWVEYVQQSFDATAGLPAQQVYHLCYESFLQNPRAELEKMGVSLGLEGQLNWAALTARVKGSRAFAFQTKPELQAFYDRVCDHPLMLRLGYGR